MSKVLVFPWSNEIQRQLITLLTTEQMSCIGQGGQAPEWVTVAHVSQAKAQQALMMRLGGLQQFFDVPSIPFSVMGPHRIQVVYKKQERVLHKYVRKNVLVTAFQFRMPAERPKKQGQDARQDARHSCVYWYDFGSAQQHPYVEINGSRVVLNDEDWVVTEDSHIVSVMSSPVFYALHRSEPVPE